MMKHVARWVVCAVLMAVSLLAPAEAALGPFSAANFLRVSAASVTAPPLSIFCWIYMTGAAAVIENMLVIGAPAGTADKFYIRATASNKASAVTSDSAGTLAGATSVGSFNVSAWNSVLGVFVGASDRRISLNNETFATDTTTKNVTGANVTAMAIGRATNNSNPLIDGYASDCAVWNAALTQADSLALASGVSPLLVRPDSLLDYWPLIGINSPENDVLSNPFAMPVNGTILQQPEPPMFRAG